MIKFAVSAFFMLMCFVGYSQTTRDVAPPKPPAPQYQASAVKKQSFFKKVFRSRNKKKGTHFEDRDEFEARMKSVSKQKKKEAKMAKKPQYSDPLYFGHKKPPVKRPPGEQKWCKECQMKH